MPELRADRYFPGSGPHGWYGDLALRGQADSRMISRHETVATPASGCPEDIAIIGYGNWDTMALGPRPPLTTIDMNLGEIGRIAALSLLTAIDEPAPAAAPNHPGATAGTSR